MRRIIWLGIKAVTGLIFILVFMAAVPFTRLPVSMLIMHFNNLQQGAEALTHTENIEVDMLAGRVSDSQSWYPFLMTYNASEGFSKAVGKDLQLTILYNFASYSPLGGGSRFFETGTPYNGAFYGAYLLKEDDDPFSYMFDASGNLIEASVFDIAKYDYLNLVIKSLEPIGKDLYFEQNVTEMSTKTFGGYEWTEVSAEGISNSPSHTFESFQQAYLQYGLPYGRVESDFEKISMYSRVWVTKLEEKNTTLVLYAMTPDPLYLEDMSQSIIYETSVVLD